MEWQAERRRRRVSAAAFDDSPMAARRNAKRLELIVGSSALMQNTLATSVAILCVCFASVSAVQTTDVLRSPGEPLLCYSCNSQNSTNATVCKNGTLMQRTPGNSSWQTQCGTQHTSCMVSVYKTSSTEDASAALLEQIWSVERRCADECDAGCLVVGERTKIIKCVSCCREDLCNHAHGAATPRRVREALLWVALLSLWLVVK